MHPTIQKDTTFTKIFVGGLPYHTNDASLRKYFEMFGDIDEAVVITDRQTGKSRGYGFVTMMDRGAAERACKDPNPIVDGRKANVNLAYLGAKPRSPQTGFSIRVQQVHPALIQRQYGLAQQCMFPQAFLQPSLVLQSHLSPSQASLSSPYLDYSSAYAPYTSTTSTGLEHYPYTPSPSPSASYLSYPYTPSPSPSASYLSYPYTPSPSPSASYLSYRYSPATQGPTISAPLTPPIHPSLNPFAGLSVPSAAYLQYPLHQPDHML